MKGNPIEVTSEITGHEVAVIDADSRLLAIAAADKEKRTLSPVKVFVSRSG